MDWLRSQAATDRLVDALLTVAGRAGDAERVAFTPFEQRGDDDALDEAVRIAAEHGFSELVSRGRAYWWPMTAHRMTVRITGAAAFGWLVVGGWRRPLLDVCRCVVAS